MDQSLEVKEIPKPVVPLTRSLAIKLKTREEPPAKSHPKEYEEDPKAFTETDCPDDKDSLIIELQEQLNKSHFVIA